MRHSEAYDRFIASMNIGYMEWHDGVPYDLDSLDRVTPQERDALEARLLARKDSDWRDAEALARINSPGSIAGLEASLSGPNREVRLRAAELLHGLGRMDDLSDVIVEALRHGALGDGLAQAERLAAAHRSPAVIAELVRGALCSDDGRAVRFVGLLYFLHGKAKEPFEWGQRPFFLRFNTKDPIERRAAFDQMCRTIGVDGSGVSCS